MSDKTGEKTGIQTAVAENVSPDDRVPGMLDGEQLALLPLRKVSTVENAAEKNVSSGRGRGRPAGSKNKSTKEWTDFLLGRYQSPLIGMAEIYSRPLAELAKDLGIKGPLTFDQAKQLLQLQKECMKELAPYLHQKQPMAVDVGGGSLLALNIFGSADAPQKEENGQPYDVKILDNNIEENQGVSYFDIENSNVQNSNVSVEDIEMKEENNSKMSD